MFIQVEIIHDWLTMVSPYMVKHEGTCLRYFYYYTENLKTVRVTPKPNIRRLMFTLTRRNTFKYLINMKKKTFYRKI